MKKPDDPGPAFDPVALVRQLNADAIRDRISQLDSERDALYVLLRAALRMEREAEKARKRKDKGEPPSRAPSPARGTG